MVKLKIYDKVSWHFPEGKNCPNIEAAKRHFKVVMEWLHRNNLLSDEGREIYNLGIDDDFSITSNMLTDMGSLLLNRHYSQWLSKIDYNTTLNINELDSFLSKS